MYNILYMNGTLLRGGSSDIPTPAPTHARANHDPPLYSTAVGRGQAYFVSLISMPSFNNFCLYLIIIVVVFIII